jgi:hypothetical protein
LQAALFQHSEVFMQSFSEILEHKLGLLIASFTAVAAIVSFASMAIYGATTSKKNEKNIDVLTAIHDKMDGEKEGRAKGKKEVILELCDDGTFTPEECTRRLQEVDVEE